MRRVLVLAFDYPPRGGSGVQRTAKFAKYLPNYGWEATVVAPDWKAGSTDERHDNTLLADVESVQQVTTGSPRNGRDEVWEALGQLPGGWRWIPTIKANFRFPDQVGWWVSEAVRAARPILTDHSFHAIFSTSPPVSTHAAAAQLKAQFGIPWVVDFRDPWTDNKITYERVWRLRKSLDRVFERKVYRQADAIIANTTLNRTRMIERHSVAPEKVLTVPNGYDEDDFSQRSKERTMRDSFRITYAGSAYASYVPDWSIQVIEKFLELRADARLRVTVAGSACKWVSQRMQHSQQLASRLELLGYLPHHQAISLFETSELLILDCPPNNPHWVPGKLYEYLRSGTRIMSICDTPSEIERIVSETRRGQAFGHQDLERAVVYLDESYQAWERGELRRDFRLNGAVQQYERRELTKKLADLLDRIVEGASGSRATPA